MPNSPTSCAHHECGDAGGRVRSRPAAAEFPRTGSHARHRYRGFGILARAGRAVARTRAGQRRAAREARCVAGAPRCLAPPTPGSCGRRRALRGAAARDRLSGRRGSGVFDHHGASRRGDRHARRSAARGAGQQCALRAQRRQCTLGQPVRRALWDRCDPGYRQRCARRRLQRGARPARRRLRTRPARPIFPAGERLAPER